MGIIGVLVIVAIVLFVIAYKGVDQQNKTRYARARQAFGKLQKQQNSMSTIGQQDMS